MVEQSHNMQAESQGSIVPDDLQPAEKDTLNLFDSLSSSLPDKHVDAFLISQAAEGVSATAETVSERDLQDGASNVVPLYAHEREVSFLQVLPKVFVAAAVLVLAVVVVPLMDNSATAPQLTQSASSHADTEATSELVATKSVAQASPSDLESADTDAAGTTDDILGEVVAEPTTTRAMTATTTRAMAPSTDTANVASGVARTTIISTESAASPSVVQSINITSAARVRQVYPAAEDSSADVLAKESDKRSAIESAAQSNEPAARVNDESVVDSPASSESLSVVDQPSYRRSIHRWKAEILKLSRLGLQSQVEQEYKLFKLKHPSHLIELDESAFSSRSGSSSSDSSSRSSAVGGLGATVESDTSVEPEFSQTPAEVNSAPER